MKKRAKKQEEVQQWDAFRKGNEVAYAHIYSNYFHKLYNYGKKFTADPTLVEDCIQQLFVELWQHRSNLGSTVSVRNYIYKSFRRKIIRKINQHRKTFFVQDALENYHFDVSLSHEVMMIREEMQENQVQCLEKGLQHLSEKQREAIFLKFYEHLSYEEISQVMEMEVKSIYDLVYKGTAKLKEHLKHTTTLSFYTIVSLLILLLI